MARQCSEQKFVTQPDPGIGGKGMRNVRSRLPMWLGFKMARRFVS
jgi:hypothetical protein